MVGSRASLDSAIDELARAEPRFAAIIEALGRPEPRGGVPGAATLLRAIVGQQVSTAAARSMWARLESAFGSPPDLTRIRAADEAALRQAGLSRQKAGYAKSLAGHILDGELDLADLPADDEQAIARLTRIRGIGRWSAEIYLLFAHGRPDIWPAGDLAVQVAIGRLFGLAERPGEKQLRALAEPWRPWRGAAAMLAWHAYNRQPIPAPPANGGAG